MQALIARFAAMYSVEVLKKSFGKFWKEVVIAILLILVFYQNLSDFRWLVWIDTIPHLKTELIETQLDLDIAIQANENLRAAIVQNNIRIEEWERVSINLNKRTETLNIDLAVARIEADAKIRAILREPTPQSCEAAFDYLRVNIDNLNFEDVVGEKR